MADDIWLSPDYSRLSCHVTLALYRPTPHTAQELFDRFHNLASVSLKLAPRVHWGKYVTGVMGGRRGLEGAYPRLEEFEKVRDEMDPRRIFTNTALRDVFGFN